MTVKPRIIRGLPRGGIGYLGVPVGVTALLVAWRSSSTPAPVTAALSAPLCLWWGSGLRADGRSGEAADEVTWESPRRHDWFRVGENDVARFRVSTCIILLGLASLIIALVRLIDPGRFLA
jgi:hypothetical protein